MFKQYRLRDYRLTLIIYVVLLSTIGVLVIGSAQKVYQTRQLYGLILGVIMMFVLSLVDYTWLLNFSWMFYIAGNVLLVAVLIFGEKINGATRWIRLGIQFQPSDLVKVILILFFAGLFSKNEDKLNTFLTIKCANLVVCHSSPVVRWRVALFVVAGAACCVVNLRGIADVFDAVFFKNSGINNVAVFAVVVVRLDVFKSVEHTA